MKIEKNKLINGTPIKKIRDFLRKHEVYTKNLLTEEGTCYSSTDADKIFNYLEEEGLIELHPMDKKVWRTTTRGNAFRKAKFIKPLNRARALNILNAFLERVKDLNRSNNFIYRVEYVGLFGSLAKPEVEEVMDIDLIITLRKTCDLHRGYNEMLYEYQRVFKFLRNKSPYLDLQENDDQISDLKLTPIQLFPIFEASATHFKSSK